VGFARSGRGKGDGEGWCTVGEESGGKGWKKEKGGEGKGWRRERVEAGKGGEEKGTAGWGREGGEGLCIVKISLKSPGPRPSLTLRLIDAPVQDLVYAIWAIINEYF